MCEFAVSIERTYLPIYRWRTEKQRTELINVINCWKVGWVIGGKRVLIKRYAKTKQIYDEPTVSNPA
jgi:hypothetical protein